MQAVTVELDNELLTHVEVMLNADLAEDQVQRFIEGGYAPLDGMLPFHRWAREADRVNGPEWIAMGGKRGPGKSHTAMAQAALDDCLRFPGLKVLFLRRIQKAAKESLEDVILRVLAYTPHRFTDDGVELTNGSRILIGGFKDDRDIDKYLGIQYDLIVIEECTQITEHKKDQIRGSLRSSKPGRRPRIYLTTNADGVGLLWFKKMFVEPAREGRETNTRFLDVTHIINPFTNPEYEAWLQSLQGPLAKAWRDGDWDAFAGMAFPQWNRDKHVIKPFSPPDHWIKWRATDWGFASPFCTLWLTKDPDTRRIYVYRELYATNLTDRQQARMIQDATPRKEKITIHWADPSLWERKNREGQVFSTADEYQAEGVYLTKADNDRLSGKRKINNLLADLPDGMPGLQITEDCPHLIEQLSSQASDKLNPEDVDTDQEDHAYDS